MDRFVLFDRPSDDELTIADSQLKTAIDLLDDAAELLEQRQSRKETEKEPLG